MGEMQELTVEEGEQYPTWNPPEPRLIRWIRGEAARELGERRAAMEGRSSDRRAATGTRAVEVENRVQRCPARPAGRRVDQSNTRVGVKTQKPNAERPSGPVAGASVSKKKSGLLCYAIKGMNNV